jgi:hypothetical protein
MPLHPQVVATVTAMINEIGKLRDYGVDLDAFPPELLEARNLLRTLDARANPPKEDLTWEELQRAGREAATLGPRYNFAAAGNFYHGLDRDKPLPSRGAADGFGAGSFDVLFEGRP